MKILYGNILEKDKHNFKKLEEGAVNSLEQVFSIVLLFLFWNVSIQKVSIPDTKKLIQPKTVPNLHAASSVLICRNEVLQQHI